MRKIFKAISWLFPIMMLLGGAAYAGKVYWGYSKGRKEYTTLQNNYTYSRNAGEDHSAKPMQDYNKQEKEDSMPDKMIWRPIADPLPEDAPPRLSVDWEGLKIKNNDVTAWIMVPAVEISYPVMQGDDNEYYLHRDINREYLYAGSIFMDAHSNASLYNYNTVIYGHNMRDGSMFARLKDFTRAEVYEKCPYFWILTSNADYLYRICSIHKAPSGSDTYALRFADYEEYRLWQDKMLSLSNPSTGETLEYQDRIVTLSTCTDNSSIRMTVQGKLVWRAF